MFDPRLVTHEIFRLGEDLREWVVNLAQHHPELSTELGIGWIGDSDAGGEFEFCRPAYAGGGFLTCYEGQGEVWIGDRWEICGPGMSYIQGAGQKVAYRRSEETRWKICWTVFRHPAGGKGLFTIDRPALVQCDWHPIRAAMEGLRAEIAADNDPQAVRGWAELLRTYALRMARGFQTGDPLWHVWHEVSSSLARPWTLDDLVELAGVGSEQVRRICKRQTGHSPMEHVAWLRMYRAASLLCVSECKLAAVAYQVGYESSYAFSAAFKRHMGITPQRYRDEHR